MLAEIYNRFSEGFDTRDLKDSKALLNELKELPGRPGRVQLGYPRARKSDFLLLNVARCQRASRERDPCDLARGCV